MSDDYGNSLRDSWDPIGYQRTQNLHKEIEALKAEIARLKSAKQPATFDEWWKSVSDNYESWWVEGAMEEAWQASSASFKQRLLERMPKDKPFTTNIYTADFGYSLCREEILKIIEELT